MSRFLLDVNVLIALIDEAHVQHEKAHEWFASSGRAAWATCPLTQNGVLRIMAHSSYPGSPGSLASIADKIKTFLAQPEHDFWPDDVSLLDPSLVRSGRLTSSRQVTDIYLLALAASRGGVLATFDQRLFTDAVVEGARALHRIA